jgi:hypothetical protein
MDATSRKKLSKTLGVIHWILIIVFYLYATSYSNAQAISAEVYVQHSVIGLQKGLAAKYTTQKGYGLGAFHQSSDNFSFETEGSNYPFSGIEVEVPFTRCGRLQLTGSIKGGFVNGKYLILTPEINTKVYFGRFIALGLGAGYRAGQTALALKLIVKTR